MNYSNILKMLVIILTVISFGCATIFHGTKDTISVRSEEEGTKIYIDEELVGKNSSVSMVRKKGEHIIRVSKEGCIDVTRPIPYSFDGTTLLGLFLDLGIITILVVDWLATGAITSASQNNFVLSPDCSKKTSKLSEIIFYPESSVYYKTKSGLLVTNM